MSRESDREMPGPVHKNGVALILVYLFVMYTCGYASYTYLRRHMLATERDQAGASPEQMQLVQQEHAADQLHESAASKSRHRLSSAMLAQAANNPSHRYHHNHHKQQSADQDDSAYDTHNSAHQSDSTYSAGHAHTTYQYLRRHMLANQSVTCNDGTVAGYYLRRAYNSRRWIVFLEGGWYCFSAVTCHQRWLKMRSLMTSAHWPEAKSGEHSIDSCVQE